MLGAPAKAPEPELTQTSRTATLTDDLIRDLVFRNCINVLLPR